MDSNQRPHRCERCALPTEPCHHVLATGQSVEVTSRDYRLSHATTLRFEVPTKVSYRLSHATTFPATRQFEVPTTSDYRLSHATTLVHRTHTSPVGHLEQFVLPTEPCHHNLVATLTSGFYQLSQQTISGNEAYYIMMKGFGQGAFSRKDETDLFCPECEGDAC